MAEDKDKSMDIQDLTMGSHLILGKLLPEFVRNIITLTEDNLEVILTWERRQHYLERHYEMFWHENLLIETVLSPDIVQRNSKDKDIALFFKKVDEEHYLRATILLNIAREKDKKHSVLSFLSVSFDQRSGNKRFTSGIGRGFVIYSYFLFSKSLWKSWWESC